MKWFVSTLAFVATTCIGLAQAQAQTVTVSASSTQPGGAVTVTVANGPGNTQDWIGLYAVNAPASSYLDWKYLNNTRSSPRTALRSATLTFSMPAAPGTYEFRFFPRDNMSPLLAKSTPVTVGSQPTTPPPPPPPPPTPPPPPPPPPPTTPPPPPPPPTTPPAGGAQFFVSPNGLATNDGSVSRPWDLQTALNHPSSVQPGATIWLRGGTYTGGFTSRLRGSTSAPIVVRQYPGERAVLDSYATPATHGLIVNGSDAWFWGFEVMSSDPVRVYHHAVNPDTPGGPDNMRGTGVNVFAPRTKFINMTVHDSATGFGFWVGAIDSEVYGCIVYNNGVVDTQRGHGHGLYIQNQTGTKNIENVISFNNFSTGMKAYTEGGYIIGINFKGIISFNNGSPGAYAGTPAFNTPEFFRVANLFVGSKGNPADRISVTGSHLYHQSGTLVNLGNMAIGYQPASHKSVVIKDNYIMGGHEGLSVYRWDTATVTGNTIFATEDPTGSTDEFIAVIETRNPAASVWNNNVYYDETEGGGNTSFWVGDFSKWWEVWYANWKSRSGFDQNTQYQRGRPTGTKVVVLPNKYEAGRANIAVYNWNNASTVDIDVSNILTVGQAYQLRNVQHLLTGPVLSGVYDGRPLRVRLDDAQVTPPTGHSFTPESTSPEFAAFLLIPRQ